MLKRRTVALLFVAIRMVFHGADQLLDHQLPNIPFLKETAPVTAAH